MPQAREPPREDHPGVLLRRLPPNAMAPTSIRLIPVRSDSEVASAGSARRHHRIVRCGLGFPEPKSRRSGGSPRGAEYRSSHDASASSLNGATHPGRRTGMRPTLDDVGSKTSTVNSSLANIDSTTLGWRNEIECVEPFCSYPFLPRLNRPNGCSSDDSHHLAQDPFGGGENSLQLLRFCEMRRLPQWHDGLKRIDETYKFDAAFHGGRTNGVKRFAS